MPEGCRQERMLWQPYLTGQQVSGNGGVNTQHNTGGPEACQASVGCSAPAGPRWQLWESWTQVAAPPAASSLVDDAKHSDTAASETVGAIRMEGYMANVPRNI
eukprot:jgi/Tetstr1/437029/TSEL_025789.t1